MGEEEPRRVTSGANVRPRRVTGTLPLSIEP